MKTKRSINSQSVKRKITLVILCLFASICTYGQKQKDLGIGTLTLQYFYYPNGIFSNDSTKNILLKRVYQIKHTRVIIKTIAPPKKIRQETTVAISKNHEVGAKSEMVAKAVYPTYLADYKNNEYFMYFENTKTKYYYKDSLKNHPEDLYNPKVNSNAIDNRRIITEIIGGEITIAGKRCLAALAINGVDTTKFYYTKEVLKFVSPLNVIPGVNNSILGIQVLQKDRKAFGLFVINIQEEELPDDTFLIPATAQFKTWSEVMELNNTPNR